MNRVILELTLRQLLGKRRTLLMLLLAAIPVAVAIIFRISGSDDDESDFASGMLEVIVITALLPIVALIFGTGALGSEIEDGTVVYILGRPIPRWQIVASKLAIVALLTASLIVISTAVSGFIALGGSDPAGLVLGFVIGALVGSVVYSCLFVLLSVLTSRALIAGLVYVFLWESVVTNIFQGVRLLSVREYALAIADAVTSVSPLIWEADLGLGSAIVGAIVVSVAAVVLTVRRLQSFEIGETA